MNTHSYTVVKINETEIEIRGNNHVSVRIEKKNGCFDLFSHNPRIGNGWIGPIPYSDNEQLLLVVIGKLELVDEIKVHTDLELWLGIDWDKSDMIRNEKKKQVNMK